MAVELSLEEQIEMMKQSIVSLLSQNPHHPFAQVLGQALMDLYEELLGE